MAAVVVSDAQAIGDVVTITGTVDGVSATVTCWKSHLVGLPTNAARLTYVATLLKTQAQPSPSVSYPVTGSIVV